MNYGEYQEEAARALNDLLLNETTLTSGEWPVALECRRQVVAVIRERLTFLGAQAIPAARNNPPRVVNVVLHPLDQLARVVDGLPRGQADPRAPTDLLPGPPAPLAENRADKWRCVARNLTLANHELVSSDDQSWTVHPSALWHLTGDAASLVEAVLVLDQGLADSGALPVMQRKSMTAERLIIGDVARMAAWFGTDKAADLACVSPLSTLGLDDGPPIQLVRRPDDFVAAQRALAAFLRPRRNDPDTTARAGLKVGRVVAVAQTRLARTFAGWAERQPDGHHLAEQFRDRIDRYQRLHRASVRLVQAGPVRSQHALAQQTELMTQLRRFPEASMSRAGLVALNAASHEVAVSLGRALRRETLQRKNILVLTQQEDDATLPKPRLMSNTRHPFYVASQALAHDPAPTEAPAGQAVDIERQRLRSTLNLRQPGSPTTSPPMPAGRSYGPRARRSTASNVPPER